MGINHNEVMPEYDHGISPVPEPETQNKKIVKVLYKALGRGDTETIARVIVAADLEWWYHGPPQCQHMMKILTGESKHSEFKFKPRSIMAIGGRVIMEGWDGLKAYWVHVWTLEGGMITQFREYFNTWLTVLLRASETGDEIPVWQSDPRERLKRSLPDLVLAI